MFNLASKRFRALFHILIEKTGKLFAPNSISSLVQWLFRSDGTGTTYSSVRPFELHDNREIEGFTYHDGIPQLAQVIKLDDVNDYIRVTDNIALRPGTSDFELEFYFRYVGDGILFERSASGTNGFIVAINELTYFGGTADKIRCFLGSAGVFESTTSVVDGAWYKFKVERVSGTVNLYLNDVLEDTGSSSVDHSVASDLLIGTNAALNRYFGGYLSTLKYSIANTLVLQLNFNDISGGVCQDASGNNFHGASTNVTLSTFRVTDSACPINYANSVGWSGAEYFSGASGARLSLASSLNLGTSYAIECMVMFEAWNGEPWGGKAGVSNIYGFFVTSTAIHHNNASATSVSATHSMNLREWHKIKVVRNGANVEIFQDDISIGSGALSSATNALDFQYFGTETGTSFRFQGYMKWAKAYNSSSTLIHHWDFSNRFNVSNQILDIVGDKHIVEIDTAIALIPRDESDNGSDITGEDLSYTGEPRHSCKLNSPCLTFPGGNTAAVSRTDDMPFTSSYAIHFRYKFNTSKNAYFYQYRGTTGGHFCYITSANQLNFHAEKSSAVSISVNLNNYITTSEEHSYVLMADATYAYLYINSVLIIKNAHGTTLQNPASGATFQIGFDSYGTLDGSMTDFIYYNGIFTDDQMLSMFKGDFSNYPTGSSLIFWLPMQEKGGNKCHDISNGRDFYLLNFTLASAWANLQQRSHYALKTGYEQLSYFNNSSSKVSMGDVLDIGTSDCTMACWIILQDMGSNTDPIMGKWKQTPSVNGFLLWADSGKIRAEIAYNGTRVLNTFGPTDIDDELLHHIAVTMDRDGNMITYLDGVTQDSVDISSLDGGDIQNTASFDIGYSSFFANRYSHGFIFNVGVWNSALGPDEIAALANSGVPISPQSDFGDYVSSANMTGYWKGNRGDWTDQVASNDGTLTSIGIVDIPFNLDGTPLYASSYEQYAGKKHNYCQTEQEQYAIPRLIQADQDSEFFTSGVPQSIPPEDIPATTTSNYFFSDKSIESQIKNELFFEETLVDDELDKVNGFTKS